MPRPPGHLRHFLEARKTFGWAYPEEIRMAAAQALMKLDPEWMQAFLPQAGLDAEVMALAPLDAIPERDFVRHRRYRRVRLPRNVPAVITSAKGKYSSAISVLSLDGGLLSGDLQLPGGNGSHAQNSCRPALHQHAAPSSGSFARIKRASKWSE